MLATMLSRRLPWLLALSWVACGKLAGFEDLRGTGGNAAAHEAGGNPGDAGEGAEAAIGGSGGVSGSGGANAGTGATAVGGTTSEGGTGNTPPAVGGSSAASAGSTNGGNAGAAATGGASGGVGGGSGTAGSNAAGGSASGGDAGTPGSGVGGATGGAGTGGAAAGTGGAAGASGSAGGAGIGNTTGCGELITNGSFEQARFGWDVMTSWGNFELNHHELIVERSAATLAAVPGVTPQAGDFLAWLGGVPDDDQEHSLFLSQPIVISDDATELVFSGFLRIESDEPLDPSYDEVYVEIVDDEYQRVWQFGSWSNEHQGPNWFAMSSSDPYPEDFEFILGQPVRFAVYSRTDDNTVTHFFFDSLSLISTCEP
jgi:hypothetical protein